jgi:drug/metabolite transporter (DMT)-like permease
MFIGRLGFLFSTKYAGLTSLILSVHVFITIALAILFLGERPSVFQLLWARLA